MHPLAATETRTSFHWWCAAAAAGHTDTFAYSVENLVNYTMARDNGLIDTRAYRRLRDFDGIDENWATWSFVARSCMALLSTDSEVFIEAAEREDNVANLALGAVSPEAVRLARTMYHILVSTVTGKALMVVRDAERSNGLQAWRFTSFLHTNLR